MLVLPYPCGRVSCPVIQGVPLELLLSCSSVGTSCDRGGLDLVVSDTHDAKIDNWAVGVLLYELLVGITPFKPMRNDKPNATLEGNILRKRVQYPSLVSQDARRFIDFVLEKDPKLRPNIVAIMAHPFWQKHKLVFKQQEEKKITIVPTLATRPEQAGEIDLLTD